MGDDLHRLEIEPVETWAAASARVIARGVGRALEAGRGCLLAVTGDPTHRPVLDHLATHPLDWDQVTLIPTHERLVPADSGRRLLPGLEAIFDALPVSWLTLPVDEALEALGSGRAPAPAATPARPAAPTPVTDRAAPDPAVTPAVEAVLARFDRRLEVLADAPPVVDLSVLGVGPDGTVAGLRPGAPALSELRRYSAVTATHDGARHLTLTRPIFDRCRAAVWLVAGFDRSEPLGRMLMGDLTLPAGMIRPRASVIVADTDAARQV